MPLFTWCRAARVDADPYEFPVPVELKVWSTTLLFPDKGMD